jgi:hypothetical protein
MSPHNCPTVTGSARQRSITFGGLTQKFDAESQRLVLIGGVGEEGKTWRHGSHSALGRPESHSRVWVASGHCRTDSKGEPEPDTHRRLLPFDADEDLLIGFKNLLDGRRSAPFHEAPCILSKIEPLSKPSSFFASKSAHGSPSQRRASWKSWELKFGIYLPMFASTRVQAAAVSS